MSEYIVFYYDIMPFDYFLTGYLLLYFIVNTGTKLHAYVEKKMTSNRLVSS